MVLDDVRCPVRRDLFGGAIEMHLSERFIDISDFRQVPDHQECFADGARDESVLVELLDFKEEVSDGESARFFFDDLVRQTRICAPFENSLKTANPKTFRVWRKSLSL